MCGILRQEGYFAELKVPLFVPTYMDTYQKVTASDLDVFGVSFGWDFSEHTVIAECKSGERDALQELLKLDGVRELVSPSTAYLVKKRIHANAREVARRLGITVFETQHLEEIALRSGLDIESVVADEDRYYRARVAAAKQLRDRATIIQYVETDFVLRDYAENINNIVYLTSEMLSSRHELTADELSWILLRAAAVLSLSLMHLCRDVMPSGSENLSREISVAMLGGPRLRRERERLLDELRKISRSKRIPDSVDPEHLPYLIDLVSYLLLTPLHAREVPSLFTTVLRATASGTLGPDTVVRYSDETKKLMRDTCEFLLKASDGGSLEARLPTVAVI